MTSLPRYSETLTGPPLQRSTSAEQPYQRCPCPPPRRPGYSRASSSAAAAADASSAPEPSRALFQGVPPVFVDRRAVTAASSESPAPQEYDPETVRSSNQRQQRRTSAIVAHAEMYERLVTGQRSELGDAPPAYEAAMSSSHSA
jgi:hypothetical protein